MSRTTDSDERKLPMTRIPGRLKLALVIALVALPLAGCKRGYGGYGPYAPPIEEYYYESWGFDIGFSDWFGGWGDWWGDGCYDCGYDWGYWDYWKKKNADRPR
jgi:hypothetical protein